MAQDRFEAFVTARAQCQRTLASGFQPLFAVLFAQAQDAQAGAEAVLRMDSALEDVGDDAGRIRACLLCPADQPLRCPLGMFAVALGHVLDLGGVAAFVRRAQMAGHALVGVEALHGLRGEPHFELVLHQLVRHRVVMAIDLDVVVNVDAYFFPFGVDVRVFRQRLQCRLVDGLER
ncbi:hypothetical protein PS639_05432 [Pseudomonas fluorescens]|nr:hypothetical protein PS639_01971 [Pseudomonas fluorescens]VVM94252.1 hypothetical protein PS639_02939 [Pseudomonas fluorescens]VVN42153.1 hypothetical protein PS639_05432 [Pseudomonas fluorescens]